MQRNIQAMATRVARSMIADDREEALEKVDEAVDAIIAALMVLDENLPKVQTASVPEKAALDAATSALNEAVKPYMADVVKALDIFER